MTLEGEEEELMKEKQKETQDLRLEKKKKRGGGVAMDRQHNPGHTPLCTGPFAPTTHTILNKLNT